MGLTIIRRFILLSVVVLSFIALTSFSASAQQDFFPFLAEANSNKINIRAGQSANFESLCKIDQGEDVVVLERKYSWYKVNLPVFADSYISADLVTLLSDIKGEVVGTRVNVRAKPNMSSSVIGKVKKGDIVYIIGLVDGWYKIEPLDNSYGWISDKLLTFVSKDISRYNPKQLSLKEKEEIRIVKEKEAAEAARQREIEEKERAARARIVDVAGLLDIDPEKKISQIRYRILVNDSPTYYIEGFEHLLDKFVNYHVRVKGEINRDMNGQDLLPVLAISKIQLVY